MRCHVPDRPIWCNFHSWARSVRRQRAGHVPGVSRFTLPRSPLSRNPHSIWYQQDLPQPFSLLFQTIPHLHYLHKLHISMCSVQSQLFLARTGSRLLSLERLRKSKLLSNWEMAWITSSSRARSHSAAVLLSQWITWHLHLLLDLPATSLTLPHFKLVKRALGTRWVCHTCFIQLIQDYVCFLYWSVERRGNKCCLFMFVCL